jgi:AcrR family transcriptional regulator
MATRRSQQKEQTRRKLYDVAMRLFHRDGYATVSVDDIVSVSGVARGTFYFHYPSKEDILYEAVRRGEREIVLRMAAVPHERPFRDVLAVTCAAFAEIWGKRRDLLADAGAVGMRRVVSGARERDEEPLRLELVQHVERALAGGELSSALPAQMLADVFLLDVFAALMAWAHTGAPSLDVVMPAVIDLFLRGAEGFGSPRPAAARRRTRTKKKG